MLNSFQPEAGDASDARIKAMRMHARRVHVFCGIQRKTAGGRDVSAGKFVLPEMLRQMFDEVAFDLRAEFLGAESPGVRAALGGIE